MLLEKERERLFQVLASRTASHAERRQAKELLEEDLASRESPPAQRGGEGAETLRRQALYEVTHRERRLERWAD
jgi:hypothetical protein